MCSRIRDGELAALASSISRRRWSFSSAQLLVVHCTPVGMHPHDGDMVPFPTSWLTPEHLVVDLIYTPAETRLLREARGRGAAVLNGADMLRLQAEKAWEIWKTSGV